MSKVLKYVSHILVGFLGDIPAKCELGCNVVYYWPVSLDGLIFLIFVGR